MKTNRLSLLFALLTQLSTINPQLSAATLTNSFTITEANTSYDGQDIVIDGATLRHSAFDLQPSAFLPGSLLLTNGGVLTHSACTASETHKLDLVVSNEVVVSTNSRVDGCLAKRKRASVALAFVFASRQPPLEAQQLILQPQNQLLPLMRIVLCLPSQLEHHPPHLRGQILHLLGQFLNAGFVPVRVLRQSQQLSEQAEKLLPHGSPQGLQFGEHSARALLGSLDFHVFSFHSLQDAIDLGDALVDRRSVLPGFFLSNVQTQCFAWHESLLPPACQSGKDATSRSSRLVNERKSLA
jgi:hypothetical protein